jgi:hypothetical protein
MTPVKRGECAMKPQQRILCFAFVWVLLATGAASSAGTPDGVSPGAVDRIVSVHDRCPTFSWQSVEGAAFYELVAYELPEDFDLEAGVGTDLSGAPLVLAIRVPGGATNWTPSLEQALEHGGRYAWFVRVVPSVDEFDRREPGLWSEARLFEVPGQPSAEEVQHALEVLHRYAQEVGEDQASFGTGLVEAAGASASSPTRLDAVRVRTAKNDRSVPLAAAAVRGEMPDPTGETYGAVGVSNSPQGAGVGAANMVGGPDLVLDGSVQGATDTLFSEWGVDRPSGGPESFEFANTGAGTMTVEVDGVEVVTTATDQDTLAGLSCGGGEVAKWDGADWVCEPDDDALEDLSCGGGQVPAWNGANWVCEDLVASVSPGDGLMGGGTGDVTLEVEFNGTGSQPAAARSDHHHFGVSWSGVAAYGINLHNTDVGEGGRFSSVEGPGVVGISEAPTEYGSHGVIGLTSSTDTEMAGVSGQNSGLGAGVYGKGIGGGYGVRGWSDGTSAVYGDSDAILDWNFGGYFLGPRGVFGKAEAPGVDGAAFLSQTGGLCYGVYTSSSAYGVYTSTLDPSNNYGLYTPNNIYSLNYNVTAGLSIIARNGSDVPLEAGDVVRVAGTTEPIPEVDVPLMVVVRAEAGQQQGVAGVVHSAYEIEMVSRRFISSGETEIPNPRGGEPDTIWQPETEERLAPWHRGLEGPAEPGGLLMVRLQGLIQAKVDAFRGAVNVGDRLVASGASGSLELAMGKSDGEVVAVALEPLEAGSGSVWVLVR